MKIDKYDIKDVETVKYVYFNTEMEKTYHKAIREDLKTLNDRYEGLYVATLSITIILISTVVATGLIFIKVFG